MKMSKILAFLLVAVMLVACLASCNSGNGGETETETKAPESNVAEGLEGTYKITMWVSDVEGVAAQFKEQIKAFEAMYPGIKIEASIESVAEGDAGSKVIADVASAPDIYCFAQDQLARLVQAAALATPPSKIADAIRAENDKGSVAAATVAGQLYAYPMTSDNGYYMYYDKSVITDPENLEKIIEDCEKSGKKIRFALENAWYTASFFFATGCHSNWTMDENGEFTAVDDDFNSAAGLAAMKGMQMLAHSPMYDSNADIFTDAAVVVTGIWNAENAETYFGANFAATDLPSFTVDGNTYHLGSFTGNKLMGVKPQTDTKRAAVLALLAQYLTSEKCQNERYESFQWGPSNINAQQSPAVQANPSLAALALQNSYGQPQGQIHGAWWDIAKVLGADAKNANTDAELQAALDSYKATIDEIVKLPPEVRRAWTVIGSVGNTNWDTDFSMTEGPDGTWTSVAIEMKAGNEFKVRQGLSWTNNFGVEFNGANIVVEADGTYQVVFVWDGDKGATITLVEVQ